MWDYSYPDPRILVVATTFLDNWLLLKIEIKEF